MARSKSKPKPKPKPGASVEFAEPLPTDRYYRATGDLAKSIRDYTRRMGAAHRGLEVFVKNVGASQAYIGGFFSADLEFAFATPPNSILWKKATDGRYAPRAGSKGGRVLRDRVAAFAAALPTRAEALGLLEMGILCDNWPGFCVRGPNVYVAIPAGSRVPVRVMANLKRISDLDYEKAAARPWSERLP